MAHYMSEPSRTFSEYLLIPGYTSEECIPANVSLRTPLVKYRKGVEDPAISLSAFYKAEDGYILRLVNNNPQKISTQITLCGTSREISFESFEVKTLKLYKDALQEMEQWV